MYYFEPVNVNQWNMFEKVKNIGHVEPFLATASMNVGDTMLLHVGLVLPKLDEFDKNISLKLTRKQTKETKELFKDKNHYRFIPSTVTFDYLPQKLRKHDPTEFYTLNFRIVRFKVTDELYETVLTNLDSDAYPPNKLKELYASRWGIETSFRDIKYTIGMWKTSKTRDQYHAAVGGIFLVFPSLCRQSQ